MQEKPKVFVTRKMPDKGLHAIKRRYSVEVWEDYAPPSKEVIIEKTEEADALVAFISDEIDAEVFNAAVSLKIVAQMAVGVDNIDVVEATRRGIYVTHTPGVLTETTADFAWALLMAVSRRVVEADKYVRTGEWKVGWHPMMMQGGDIHGAVLGIVGLGRIGHAIARRAKGFDMTILYHDVIRRPDLEGEENYRFAELDDLFQEADFITINVPLTGRTQHLVDERRLKLMKKTAYLTNNARGSIVDEKALYTALKEGWIAGAALDVFEQEPTPASNPLLKLNNLVVTPHISSASYKTRLRMAEMVAENLRLFFEGHTPPNLVNTDVLNVSNKGQR